MGNLEAKTQTKLSSANLAIASLLRESRSHHLSIGGPPDLRLALSEEAEGKSLQKCEQVNDQGITVNSAINPSVNVMAAANKARRFFFTSSKGYSHA